VDTTTPAQRSGDVDAVIVGAGLSGLSLAAHLAAGAWRDRRVLIVDGDDGAAAQAWGSWTAAPGLLDTAASRTYHQVRVYAGGTSRVVRLGRYRYQLVRRPDLRQAALARLAGAPGFTLLHATAQDVRAAGDAVEVRVDGRPVRASWAFDSRRRSIPAPDARLAFTGWSIHSERPVFDPATPTLFDFRVCPGTGARFVYVLPDDRHRALVELTEFVPRSATPATPVQREVALAGYLHDVAGVRGYTIEAAESAVVPLSVRPANRARGRILDIGARGGLIKASTGYAFQRIQRDCAAIEASLAKHGHPFGLPRQRLRHRMLDAILLRVLDRDPADLECAFSRLFSGPSAEPVLRFLDEDTGPIDELRLIRALPPLPFLRALVG
jgi:lycopene beta-cyclase